MQHFISTEKPQSSYKVALLIKQAAFQNDAIQNYYTDPLEAGGIPPSDIISYSLTYTEKNKAPVKLIKESLETVLKACKSQNIKTLFVADSPYFKVLAGEKKADPNLGYIKPCAIEGYEDMNVILSLNYQALFYKPDLQKKLTMSIQTLVDHHVGQHEDPGTGIIHSEEYPDTVQSIEDALNRLLTYPALTTDIEGYGLDLKPLGTIAFAWDKHNGLALQLQPDHTTQGFGYPIHEMLREFFETYTGTLIFHSASFDIKQLIFSLYMKGVHGDYKGTIAGLKTFFRSIHCSKVLTYLATNSTARNELGLKQNAFEFAGNYAQEDIKDISKIPFPELKQYNLVDCLSTWYVFDKNMPKVVKDDQLTIYNELMIPSLKVITNMELVGMPISLPNVIKAENQLENIANTNHSFLKSCDEISTWEFERMRKNAVAGNAKLKKKVNPMHVYAEPFKPSSSHHVGELLHEQLGLEVKDTTETGLPAVGAKPLMKIANQLISTHKLDKELYEIR